MTIFDNYTAIKQIVNETALTCGRNPGEIRIIAVSKTFPVADINEAIAHGITLFGENRIQEAKEKKPLITGNHSLHLIGHLQSNKAKEAIRLFDCIHSIDKFETAEKVNHEAFAADKVQEILVQVNTSGEASKSGCSPRDALMICKKISQLKNIRLSGLMTIGPLTDNKDSVKLAFSLLRQLRDSISQETGLPLKELSMGMSGDFEAAIIEGATLLRIGSAIFGNRTYA